MAKKNANKKKEVAKAAQKIAEAVPAEISNAARLLVRKTAEQIANEMGLLKRNCEHAMAQYNAMLERKDYYKQLYNNAAKKAPVRAVGKAPVVDPAIFLKVRTQLRKYRDNVRDNPGRVAEDKNTRALLDETRQLAQQLMGI